MSFKFEDIVVEVIDRRQRQAAASRYFNDPAAWSQDMLGIRLWSKQAEIGESVVKHKDNAVKAAHGVGKSFFVAILICWWIDTRYPNAFVASTAPSQAQIGAIVWRYVRQLKAIMDDRYKRGLIDHTLPGYITNDNQWKEPGGVILGYGRKPPDQKESDSFQGLHDAYVLAIGDEAVGLSEGMIDALGNITSNEGSRRVLILNPTNPASYVGKLFKEKPSNWKFHTISVFDSPNFTDEAKDMSPEALAKLVGPSYVEQKRAEYGENSPRYISRVLGEFAYDLGDTLIKPEDLAVGFDVLVVPDPESPVILGVDVARFGADLSTIYSYHDGKLRFVAKDDQGHRVTATAAWVNKWAVDLNATEVRVDAIGIGGGVIDALIALEPKYIVREMNANFPSPDKRQWHNARAYWWDKFRQRVRSGQIDLYEADENLADELQSVEYKFNAVTGGLLIESKEDMKKRGMKSPDFADAAIYASADLDVFTDAPKKGKVYTDLDVVLGESDAFPVYFDLMRTW